MKPSKTHCGVHVKLRCATEGATIHFTVDGSEPSLWNGEVYTPNSVIDVKQPFVRATAFKSGLLPSAFISERLFEPDFRVVVMAATVLVQRWFRLRSEARKELAAVIKVQVCTNPAAVRPVPHLPHCCDGGHSVSGVHNAATRF